MSNKLAQKLLTLLAQHSAFARMPYAGKHYIVPVAVREDIQLQDLREIDGQKQAVLDNLSSFLQSQPYNHMLLWGARGTGKSSLLRSAFLAKQAQGLKILQLACDDLNDLAYLLWVLGQSEAKFLVYIDDLSFGKDDGSYRALKAVLDGSITGIPANVMLCVTSNRRHLLAEYHRDDNALHPEEDIEEQISLSERFGLRLSFHPLSQQQFLDTIAHILSDSGLKLTPDLERQALQYALARGSRSARVATQFVQQLD